MSDIYFFDEPVRGAPVFNLLPWRDFLYRRRQKRLLLLMLLIAVITVALSFVRYWDALQLRRDFDSKNAAIMNARLQQDLIRPQPATEASGRPGFREQLDELIQRHGKQEYWRQLFTLWTLLPQDTSLTRITGRQEEMLINGRSHSAKSLRILMSQDRLHPEYGYQADVWQLQQLVMDADGVYQFGLRRVLQEEAQL